MKHIVWQPGKPLLLLDQRKLPWKKEYVTCKNCGEVAAAIKDMVVRGAPAIGAVAAVGMALAAEEYMEGEKEGAWGSRQGGEGLLDFLEEAGRCLKESRPTAVNLAWAVDRMLARAARGLEEGEEDILGLLTAEAEAVSAEDIAVNKRIGRHGLTLLPPAARILTYCNAGSLATAGYGTALGVVRAGHQAGRVSRVYACETRPYLQGARLTVYELSGEGIPVTLVTDNSAGYIMYNKMIDIVLVGADRITRQGHVANKIGTYSLAVLAHKHQIPFYVAAPLSTFDLKISGLGDIPIEEREPFEVTHLAGKAIACEDVEVFHPAFDVTPAPLVTALITEKGIIREPDEAKILQLFGEDREKCS